MNRRTCFLLTVSILAPGSLSCHGPETGALNPKTAAKLLESSHNPESRVDKMLDKKELIPLVGLVDSFL